MIARLRIAACAAAAAVLVAAAPKVAAATDLTFYYPVAVGGPITKIIDEMVAGFQKEHADVTVKAVYAGTYQDTITKGFDAGGSQCRHSSSSFVFAWTCRSSTPFR